MTEMFQGFESLRQQPEISLLGYCASALAGWATIEIPLAIEFFLIPHGSNFAPEIGPVATFVVFSVGLTIGFLILFLVLAVPLRLLLAKADGHIAKRLLPLASAGAFALLSGVFVWFESSARNVGMVAAHFAIAGIACMAVMQIAAK